MEKKGGQVLPAHQNDARRSPPSESGEKGWQPLAIASDEGRVIRQIRRNQYKSAYPVKS
ncbi:hypothetical protein NG791_08675 [Laspinema sp. D1]|nr:hypothetical protein [Laspinema sp. D2b]